jgi:hypothetical protein
MLQETLSADQWCVFKQPTSVPISLARSDRKQLSCVARVRNKECRGVLKDDKERHGVALPAFLTTSCKSTKRYLLKMREWKGEGRMSHLKLRARSGKVVLERAEGVASCLRMRLTSFSGGMQHLISAPHEIRM